VEGPDKEEILVEEAQPELGVCWSVEKQPGPQPPMPFTPCRSQDDRLSSTLLRAVAQLRSQLRAHLPRAPPTRSRIPSAWCWVGGALLGPTVLCKRPCLCLVALCEAEKFSPTFSTAHVVESHFNWKLFWHFLRPHLLLLGAAIVVRLFLLLHTGDRKDPGRCL
jgi:ATP-binding cassette subfamily B (MDR/TAP) protein 8